MPIFVAKRDRVASSLTRLRELEVHPHFPGYLCLKREATREGRTSKLKMPYKDFYEEFLRIPGSPEGYPYVYPFIEEQPSDHNRWMNTNLAGTYAPSSIRPGLPFDRVVEVTRGSNTPYALRKEHWKLAKEHLLHDKAIPIAPLVLFLYRDYGVEGTRPTITALVSTFRSQFGYLVPGQPNGEYAHLFDEEEVPGLDASDTLFEALR